MLRLGPYGVLGLYIENNVGCERLGDVIKHGFLELGFGSAPEVSH
jgi:hypothetical protein